MMSDKSLICDRELLRQSLDDRLPEGQEEELARHLAECASCRRELELLAGGEEDWSKISTALRREADSWGSPTGFLADRSAEADDSPADFAVDFLEPATSADSIGRLGDVDILEVIGRGGMGIVLKGFQPELKRLVAVKVLGPHLATSGAARKRFAREAQAAAAILHPNVVPILTVHSSGKLPYLVMPYVACESLQHRIARDGPLELVDILRIGMQTAGGLASAHAQGLVHRDVKPANILLEKGVDRVILTDFGLARAVDDASITRSGIIAGTPQFMSPEQARGEAIDARSDLFSLGSVLYTMAAGRPPFRAESTFGILRRITDNPHRAIREINPQIPGWLEGIIDKLLAKRPADRFGSAEEVAAILEQCLAHVQQPAGVALPATVVALIPLLPTPEDAVATASSRQRPTRRTAAAVLLASIVAVGGIAGVIVVMNPRGVEKKNDSSREASDTLNNSSGISAASGASRAATTSDRDADWDDSARQLDSLLQDGERFVPRAGRLWDVEPTSPTSIQAPQDSSVPNSDQPSDQETRE